MKRFVLDGNKVIIGSNETEDRVDEVTFEANEVYSVDLAVTKGSGKTRTIGTRPTVYRRNIEETYMLKMKSSRAVLSEVDSRFPVFPFSARAVIRCGVTASTRSGLPFSTRIRSITWPFSAITAVS